MSDKNNDSFWDLGDFRKKPVNQIPRKINTDIRTASIEVESRTSVQNPSSQGFSDSGITKFIPPRSDVAFKKKHVIFEYEPSNPFIKKVRFLSEKEGDSLFSRDNLFMRERAALLSRSVAECEYAPFYSYAPRYSQLTKLQLKYYLWWRENARNGVFLRAEESYIMLYAYELAATGEDEDTESALSLLCSLLTAYPTRQLNVMIKTMIRDIICDFCLVHKLTPPQDKLALVERHVINNSFLPEMFADLNIGGTASPDMVSNSMSLYDYKKSKFYTEENAQTFDKAIMGSLCAVMRNSDAFEAITSFTRGVYGAVTSERHPFNRMVNIVNKNIVVEVTYFELSNVRPAITDIIRYSENKVREHLGIKNKISIMSVNPIAKNVIDDFFSANYPPRPAIDRRRRDAQLDGNETHEYDKLYDLPKSEISPERALEIERQSWDTTKILTEAFVDECDVDTQSEPTAFDKIPEQKIAIPEQPTVSFNSAPNQSGSTYDNIRISIGEIADLIKLCAINASPLEQRKFASAHGMSVDEIADTINEAAVNTVGDIILESDGMSYAIIEDYKDLFDDL